MTDATRGVLAVIDIDGDRGTIRIDVDGGLSLVTATKLASLPSLTEIRAVRGPLKDGVLAALTKSKTVSTLRLHGLKLGSNDFADVAAMPHLKKLVISGGTVQGSGLVQLGACSLSLLALEPDGVIGAFDTDWLSGMDELDTLSWRLPRPPSNLPNSLENIRIASHGTLSGGCFDGSDKVRKVRLADVSLDEAGWRSLERLRHLSSLSLEGMDLAGVKVALPRLKELALARCAVPDRWFREASLPDVEVVRVSESDLSGVRLEYLKTMGEIESLEIRRCRLTGMHLETICELQSLKHLVVSGNPLGSTDFSSLSQEARPNLTLFYLDDTGIDNSGVVWLSRRFPNLRVLNASDNRLDDGACKTLASMKSLREVYLDGNQITDDGIVELAGLRRIEVLGLGSTGVTPGGVEFLLSKWRANGTKEPLVIIERQ